ncbi:hypothetical protein KY289_018995 [Solanum tuberosum]|nr:hypothetical protein KY289_018995 [Solanum tuberosum]
MTMSRTPTRNINRKIKHEVRKGDSNLHPFLCMRGDDLAASNTAETSGVGPDNGRCSG